MKTHALILLALLSTASTSQAASCLHYAGEPVTLTGRLTLQTFFGPPNYGENPESDARETQAILVLSKPICVDANPKTDDLAEEDQRKVTLVAPHGVNLGRYKGKRISLRGTLFHAITAHHHTPVLMEVKTVESVRD